MASAPAWRNAATPAGMIAKRSSTKARRSSGIVLPTARGEPPIGYAYYTPEPVMPRVAEADLADVRDLVSPCRVLPTHGPNEVGAPHG